MRVLVTSVKDIASQTIKEVLIDEYGFTQTKVLFEGSPVYALDDLQLITTQNDMIHCGHLEETFSPEVFIFCSRHRSESQKPALLVHSTGNLGHDASYGGQPQQLSVSAPTLISTALRVLYTERDARDLQDFDVSLEVTHHGPTSMKTPLVFIELGSSEEYWRHVEGDRAVASAIMRCAKTPLEGEASLNGRRSAAESIQEVVGSAPVVSAFQTVPAAYLNNIDAVLNVDVLVAGDDDLAIAKVSRLVRDIPNLRPLRVGPLENSKRIESTTPPLLNAAILNGLHDPTIRVVPWMPSQEQ